MTNRAFHARLIFSRKLSLPWRWIDAPNISGYHTTVDGGITIKSFPSLEVAVNVMTKYAITDVGADSISIVIERPDD